jgi:MoaA/NifB/PqqE/SkfB family radical SAM enzyme
MVINMVDLVFFMTNKKKMIKNLIRCFIPYGILVLHRSYIQKKDSKKQRKLLFFEVSLVDHCNLNCKGCSHFSPLAQESYLDIDIFKRDCARLAELTNGKIEEIHLMGGEPLLHPKLINIIDITRHYFNVGIIKLSTNGILLEKLSDIFWETCKKNNVIIVITNYPIKINRDTIKDSAEKYSVKLQFTGGEVKTMRRDILDIQGRQNAKKSFQLCFKANFCSQLRNGKLYTCPTIPYIEFFNKFFKQNLEVREEDYIDIYKAKNIDEIFDFLCKPVPFCRYCNIKATINEIEWGVSKREISEWS